MTARKPARNYYNTLTVIGRPIAPAKNRQTMRVPKVPPWPSSRAGRSRSAILTRWTTKAEQGGEQTPVYSIGFELYENGISRALVLDYTDFTITGEMTSLELKDGKPCP